MLAVTDTASAAIRALVESAELPAEAGLRIAAEPGAPHGGVGTALGLELAESPAEDDEVVEGEGAHVFLDAEASAILAEAELDATVEGDRIGFRLTARG